MNSGRVAWIACLVIALFVSLGGQTWALDASTSAESDVTISVPDDNFVALSGSLAKPPARTPIRPLPLDLAAPSDRLIVSDLFRPPELASR